MNKKIVIVFSFLIIANIVSWFFVFNEKDCLEVVFFDVGQGDSIFIETKQGHQILIDGGKDKTVLSKLENEMDFFDKEIDLVILTHPDKDHFGGLTSVLDNYEVLNFMWTGVLKDSFDFNKFKSLLDDENVIIGKAGQTVVIDDISLKTLHPQLSLEGKEAKNLNDSSLVFKLIYGNSSFLLTGDLTCKMEEVLINNDYDLSADILKVGHHGSKYSTCEDFLKEVSPKYAIIQVGENNYGHPDSEVLDRLEENNIKVMRTDLNSDVKFYSNGKQLLLKKNRN